MFERKKKKLRNNVKKLVLSKCGRGDSFINNQRYLCEQ